MRAPLLARMAAVAAPRPEAEPVITAQRPSLDIALPHIVFECLWRSTTRSHLKVTSLPRIVRQARSASLHSAPAGAPATTNACQAYGFSPSWPQQKPAEERRDR